MSRFEGKSDTAPHSACYTPRARRIGARAPVSRAFFCLQAFSASILSDKSRSHLERHPIPHPRVWDGRTQATDYVRPTTAASTHPALRASAILTQASFQRVHGSQRFDLPDLPDERCSLLNPTPLASRGHPRKQYLPAPLSQRSISIPTPRNKPDHIPPRPSLQSSPAPSPSPHARVAVDRGGRQKEHGKPDRGSTYHELQSAYATYK